MFYLLSAIILTGALGVLFLKSPIYGALSFMISMLGMSLLFFDLEAYFLGGVHLAVYSGAVTVLFIMLLMAFSEKKQNSDYSYYGLRLVFRFVAVSWPLGLVLGLTALSFALAPFKFRSQPVSVEQIGFFIFENFLIPFEAMGMILLAIAVGAVCLAKWQKTYSE